MTGWARRSLDGPAQRPRPGGPSAGALRPGDSAAHSKAHPTRRFDSDDSDDSDESDDSDDSDNSDDSDAYADTGHVCVCIHHVRCVCVPWCVCVLMR